MYFFFFFGRGVPCTVNYFYNTSLLVICTNGRGELVEVRPSLCFTCGLYGGGPRGTRRHSPGFLVYSTLLFEALPGSPMGSRFLSQLKERYEDSGIYYCRYNGRYL